MKFSLLKSDSRIVALVQMFEDRNFAFVMFSFSYYCNILETVHNHL